MVRRRREYQARAWRGAGPPPAHGLARRYDPRGTGRTGGLAPRSSRRSGPTPRRRPPCARKKVPTVIPALLSIVGPQTGGDPMGETKFVRPSLQTLGTELGGLGFPACPTTVARLFRGQGDSPRIHAKPFTRADP